MPVRATSTTRTPDDSERRRLSILQVCDSVFPIGAFALSNGMETFVQRDLLSSAEHFEQYMKNYLEVAPYKEIGQMAIAGKIATDKRISGSGFAQRITELDALCSALQSAREIREGSTRMCLRMIKLVDQMEDEPLQTLDARDDPRRAHGSHKPAKPSDSRNTSKPDEDLETAEATETPAVGKVPKAGAALAAGRTSHERSAPHLDAYARLIDSGECLGLHSIAMGLFAADRGTDLEEAAVTYCYSLLSALTVCAVKSVPISQFGGQVALRRVFPQIVSAVNMAFTLKPEDLGISGAYFDVAAMQHETLYSRLYMS
jgi:urease accessory protein